jgi:MFS family permease
VGGIAARGDVAVPVLGVVHGWQLAFMLVGLPGLLMAALTLTIREPARRNTIAGGSAVPVSAVVDFLRQRRRLALCFVVGISMAFTVSYALLAWVATFFIRVHGMAVGQVGTLLGAIILSMSTLGIFGGGWLASVLLRRGQRDATLSTAMWTMAAAIPFLIAAPLLPTPALSMIAYAPAILLSSVFISLGTSTIQLVTPNEMRGQVSALGLMLTTVVGSILGPSLVAACTDYLFADGKMVGVSLALVCGIVAPVSVLALAWSLKPLRTAAEQAEGWAAPDDRA